MGIFTRSVNCVLLGLALVVSFLVCIRHVLDISGLW